MTNYRLPMDADGVKYHGTVDQNEENPGHFMYGLDENGNKRIIRTDEQGNVLTRVTGSIVELIEGRVVESRETNNLWIGASEYETVRDVYGIDVSKYRYLNLLVANYTERPIELRRNYFGTQQD